MLISLQKHEKKYKTKSKIGFFSVACVAALLSWAGKPTYSYAQATTGVTVKLENNCSVPLTPMMLPNFKDEAEKASQNSKITGIDPNNVGVLQPGKAVIFTIANGWKGRIWTGKDRWNDAGTATLAEFAINIGDNMHWYDVSYIDGYNVPIRITPQRNGALSKECFAPSKCKMTTCVTSGESNAEGVMSQRCEGPCLIGQGARKTGSLERCKNGENAELSPQAPPRIIKQAELADKWERACNPYRGEYAQEPNPSPAKELVEAYSFSIQDKATKACRADAMDSFVVSFCYK
ncbi:MAG: thaumatin family protein [Pseudomonadota bacterium]